MQDQDTQPVLGWENLRTFYLLSCNPVNIRHQEGDKGHNSIAKPSMGTGCCLVRGCVMVGWRERSESLMLVSSSSRRCDYALCLPQHSSWGDKELLSDSVIRSANIKAQSANCGQLMCYLDVMEFLTHCIAFHLLISDQDGCDVLWGQKGDMTVMVLWHEREWGDGEGG